VARPHAREAGGVPYGNAPEWMQSWDLFRTFAFPLEDCLNLVYDGVRYTHALHGSGYDAAVVWSTPIWLKNPRQMTLIRGYVELAEAAGLKRLIRMSRH